MRLSIPLFIMRGESKLYNQCDFYYYRNINMKIKMEFLVIKTLFEKKIIQVNNNRTTHVLQKKSELCNKNLNYTTCGS